MAKIIAITLSLILLAGCTRSEDVTPLMMAAKSGNTAQVRKLIADGAKLNDQSLYGWTALMFAAWQGHVETAKVILDAGADPNIGSAYIPSQFETVGGHPPSSALQEAIRNGHLSLATMLVKRGARIDASSVALAGAIGDVDFLTELKQSGINFDAFIKGASYATPTPLCRAAENGKLAAVEWLIKNGANPNQTAPGQTALKEAVVNDDPKIVLYLLDHGADPNVVYDFMEHTALFTAVTKYTRDHNYAANIAIIGMLLSHGADTRHKSFSEKYTALEFIRIQKTNSLKYIEGKSADEIQRLHAASLRHLDNVIALLEKHQAQIQVSPTHQARPNL